MSDKLIELYVKKFLNGKLEFGGITLIPNLVKRDDGLVVEWDMENRNDIPYSMVPIEEEVKESFIKFSNLVGLFDFTKSHYYTEFREVRDKFEKLFKKKIKNFKFKQDYFSPRLKNELDSQVNKLKRASYLNIEFVYKIIIYQLRMFHDEFEVFCEIDIIEARRSSSGEEISWKDLHSFLDELARKGDFYELNDVMTDSLDRLVLKYPTFINRLEMYLTNRVTYLYEDRVIVDS